MAMVSENNHRNLKDYKKRAYAKRRAISPSTNKITGKNNTDYLRVTSTQKKWSSLYNNTQVYNVTKDASVLLLIHLSKIVTDLLFNLGKYPGRGILPFRVSKLYLPPPTRSFSPNLQYPCLRP